MTWKLSETSTKLIVAQDDTLRRFERDAVLAISFTKDIVGTKCARPSQFKKKKLAPPT